MWTLRKIPIIKLVAVALVWVLLIALLPIFSEYTIYSYGYGYSFEPLMDDFAVLQGWEAIQLGIFVVSLCIPFEIRDLKYDEHTLGTLPQLIGVGKTKMLGIFLCGICILMEWLQFQFAWNYLSLIATGIYLLTSGLIAGSGVKKPDWYAGLVVETVPGFWLFVLLCLEVATKQASII